MRRSLLTFVHEFVTSRIDHCNGLLFGSYSYLLDRLQYELNSAARQVLNISKFSNISAAICDELHWLPIRRRIDFKIALIVRHCMVGTVPEYLMELCHLICSAVGRQCLQSASCGELIVCFDSRHSVIGPLLFQAPILPLKIRQSRDNLLLFKK